MAKVEEAVRLGATQILMQGGLNPDLSIEYFEEVFSAVKRRFGRFGVHFHHASPCYIETKPVESEARPP